MASIINSDDGVISGTAGLKSTGANDGALNIQTNGTNAITVSSAQTVAINGNNISADNSLGFRNRIINGDMRIDQRNAGASFTPTNGGYGVDRFGYILSQASKITSQRSTTAPTGFTNSLLVTSSAATSVGAGDYYTVYQAIEGFNVADLGWGTASAKSITISFWVRSSLTGTFGGSVINKYDTGGRYYQFTYTINAANTWEQKTVTIAGDTSGTWATNNTAGLYLSFSLGVGSTYSATAGSWGTTYAFSPTGATQVVATNGATWYITGVQLEVGSVATPFERRDYGRELIMCQRYYYRNSVSGVNIVVPSGYSVSTTVFQGFINFPVSMRTAPSALEQTGTASNYVVERGGSASYVNCSAVPAFGRTTTLYSMVNFTVASGLVNGDAGSVYSNSVDAYLGWSAEL